MLRVLSSGPAMLSACGMKIAGNSADTLLSLLRTQFLQKIERREEKRNIVFAAKFVGQSDRNFALEHPCMLL